MSLWRRVYQERRAVMLPLVIFLVASAIVLGVVVLPLAQNVSTLEADAQNASTNLIRARFKDKQAKDALGSKDRADEELKKFYAEILPTAGAGARRVIAFLRATADQNGVQFNSSNLDQKPVDDSQLMRVTGNVTLTGTYANMRKFLYVVETAEEFVVVESVGLKQESDTRAGAAGRLEVNLDVATYYLAPPAPTQ
jgi:Tfp pilus assembly protein PilO